MASRARPSRVRVWVAAAAVVALSAGAIEMWWRSHSGGNAAGGGGAAGVLPSAVMAADPPFGIDRRVAWTSSHVAGSPEAPPPYVAERVFPRVTFKNPVDIAFAPGSDRVFVLEQFGKVYSFPNSADPAKADLAKADLFADLKADVRGADKVPDAKGVEAAYGMTFHPQFQQNHYWYVCYVLADKTWGKHIANGTRVSRFTVVDTDPKTGKPTPPRIDPDSEVILIDWYEGGHNGGSLQFGPDGCLYISAGDGADPNPPDGINKTGQDISDLLSSVLRIDVDHPDSGKAYGIPSDNPFVKTPGARGEVWAYGFRNPWKMSFDRATGQLWVGDVGWELWEMVDRAVRGGNYGWSIMEGPQPVHVNDPQFKPGPTPILKPDLALPHTESASISGGFVYRGKRLPELAGHYVFGDWVTRTIWAAKVTGPDGSHLEPYRTIAQTDSRIIGFGQDAEGELYIGDYEGGGMYRLAPNPDAGRPSTFPRKLSETGLFADVGRQTPAPGVVPFRVNAEQWNEGATAERFVAVPGSEAVGPDDPVQWPDTPKMFPKGTVLARTFTVRADWKVVDGGPRRVETQLLHYDGKGWNGYTYRWNDAQTDADLVDAGGAEQTISVADTRVAEGRRPKVWHYQSRAQCLTCHTTWTNFTLGYTAAQLDRPATYGGVTDNQVRTLRHVGLLSPPRGPYKEDGKMMPAPPPPKPLANPYDERSGDVEARARSYLQVNCSHCHRFGGGGATLIDLQYDVTLEKSHAVGTPPLLGSLGLADARVIAPGDPGRSVLLCRMAKVGSGRMPKMGSDEVDREGVALLTKWIAQLGAQPAPKGAVPPDPSTATARAADAAAFQAARAANSLTLEASAAVDKLLATPSGALSLAAGLDAGGVATPIREAAVARGSASSIDTVRDLFEPFVPPDKLAQRLGTNIDRPKLLAMKGDADRGRQVFFETSGGLCAQCHQIDGRGQEFGPDLSHIATKYDRAALLENILEPSKTIDPQYVTYLIRAAGRDDPVIGLVVERTPAEVVVKDTQRQTVRIPVKDVQKETPQPQSAMPDGLLGALTPQQAADLLEYLAQRR